MNKPIPEAAIPLRTPLFRGERALRIALVGMPASGKSTLFRAVSSTAVQTGKLTGTKSAYGECAVQIGLDEARLIDLPSIHSLRRPEADDLATLKYLLWGDERPPVSVHEPGGPPAPFAPPDLIVQVVDAAALEHHLELALELTQLGRPMVIALNRMDEAWEKGLYVNHKVLGQRLGVPVVPVVALTGHGISELFAAAVNAVRQKMRPTPQPASTHISARLEALSAALRRPSIEHAFHVPHDFLVIELAEGNPYFLDEMQQHFPEWMPVLQQLLSAAGQTLPRPLSEELHADRHHRAASLFEAVTRLGTPYDGRDWRYWLDQLFLHPYWGLIGSLAVFAGVLFVVFGLSARLDAMTTARLIEWTSPWQPASTGGVIARAVVDGMIGLVGIIVPYMIPLVLLLVALEEVGVMARIAFAIDRGFHYLGLHGGVAVPFLLGLGCNVPAIAAIARSTRGRERVVASMLSTFVPCSARSAIILAVAGKYLGLFGVFGVFLATFCVIAVVGRALRHRYPKSGPGQVQEIPPFALPRLRPLLAETWVRTKDILTIVTPLLVAGSVVLALLNHVGATAWINTVLTPITYWWLGLPVVLGMPILFGVLRKELSLLMIYQALGTFEIGDYLNAVQITTFLLFLTFYVPCVSTFAVMHRKIGGKDALFSVALSVGVALAASGMIRVVLESMRYVSS